MKTIKLEGAFKRDLAKYIPRKITLLIARLLVRLMKVDKKYDIILYNELREFIKYNKRDNGVKR